MNNKNPSEKRLELYKKSCESIVRHLCCEGVICRDCPFYEDNNGHGVGCEEIISKRSYLSVYAKRFIKGKIVFHEGRLVEVEDEDKPSKKYEFTGETNKELFGTTLHRIKRISDGLIGGWIEKEDNLSHEGDCFVFGDAKVYGDAKVSDNAKVSNNAKVRNYARVSGDAKVFDNARVSDSAEVYGSAKVYGRALVCRKALVCENVQVFDDAKIHGNAEILGDAWVYGDAEVFGEFKINTGKISSGVHR